MGVLGYSNPFKINRQKQQKDVILNYVAYLLNTLRIAQLVKKKIPIQLQGVLSILCLQSKSVQPIGSLLLLL